MKKKILGILPESIGGRLTITSLFRGFEQLGFYVFVIDKLDKGFDNAIKAIKPDDFEFLVSYDFVGIEIKVKFGLNIKTVNYFSDVIESNCSGAYWKEYYAKLKDKDNFVFYWDKSLTEKAGSDIANLFYLPHAVDIETYKNTNAVAEYDVMFAGRLTYGIRTERFLNILKGLPDVKFALYCFPKHLDLACEKLADSDANLLKNIYKGFIDTEEKMSEAINKSKIVINFTSQGESSINYRCFQVLACEKLLLTDYRAEVETLFTPETDIVYYKDDNELIEKIKDCLENPDKYSEIIKNGRKTVEAKYSSKIAAEFILKHI